MNRWLFHPWLAVRVQMVLGSVFVVAAFSKIADPAGFAKSIWAYGMLPWEVIRVSATLIPWIEMVAGVALFFGIWSRGAALWLGVLLLVFIAALGINLHLGRVVDCGCFGSGAVRLPAEGFHEMKLAIIRDVALVVLAVHVMVVNWKTQDKALG